MDVANDISLVNVTATKNSSLATVHGNGNYYLTVGENTISIYVTAEDSSVTLYKVIINRSPNSDASLTAITTNPGVITIEDDVYDYEINAGFEEEYANIIPQLSASTSTYEIHGNNNLQSGANEFTITVTAQDKVTTENYRLTINKDRSPNSSLSELFIEEGEISPNFSPFELEYEATIPYEYTSATIHIETESPLATYVIEGNENFNVGRNTVTITVTPETGEEDNKVHTIIITREEESSSNTYLSELSFDEGLINPEFVKNRLYYTATVPYEIAKVKVRAEAEDETTRVISGYGDNNLELGVNKILVVTEAQDGKRRTYKLVIKK